MIRFTLAILVFVSLTGRGLTAQQAQTSSPPAARAIGTVTAINGNTLSIKADSGNETKVTVQDSTRIVKAEPGQRDLKNATPIHLQDVQVGDRALARGKTVDDGSVEAATLIVMKQVDVASLQQQQVQEWQRRGAGGIVRSIDPSSGTITVSTAPNQTVSIQTSKNTLFLRYAPDSVKFSDAQKGSIDEIKPGDQLRARGNRSGDGQVTADAVISGSFRNIAGTVTSIDASANTLTVNDAIAKKSVLVKITPDTQMRKIPPETAQRIAMFLRRSSGQGSAEAAQGSQAGGDQGTGAEGGAAGGSGGRGPGAGGQGGRADFQQIIRRMPSATINDLQKGDAVMIVTTSGIPGQQVTALTLLSGVEPILTAAPTQTSANLLSGWSMGGGGEGENQ